MFRLLSGIAHLPAQAAGALMSDEDGVTTVEIVLILVVLISLVIIFRDQIQSIVTSALSKASSGAEGFNTE